MILLKSTNYLWFMCIVSKHLEKGLSVLKNGSVISAKMIVNNCIVGKTNTDNNNDIDFFPNNLS